MNLDLGNTITQAITIVYGEPFLDLHSDSQIPICRTVSYDIQSPPGKGGLFHIYCAGLG